MANIFMNKKIFNKKNIIIGSIFAALLLLIIILTLIMKNTEPKGPIIESTVLKKGEMVNTVKASGVIASTSSSIVFAKLQNPIEKINVKVGDRVSKGDVVATLDTESVRLDIEQQRQTLNNSKITMRIDLQSKQRAYQALRYQYNTNSNPELLSAIEQERNAKIDLDNKKLTYENNLSLYESDAVSKYDLDQSKIAYQTSIKNLEKSKLLLKITKTKMRDDLNIAIDGIKLAKANLNNNSQETAIRKLEASLKDGLIRATSTGTVTSVNATEGSVPSGAIFTVEDTDNLEISLKVKEFDSNKIKPGQSVTIHADATGEKKFTGTVKSISPTSVKDAGISSSKEAGASPKSTTSPEFEVKIKIFEKDKNLKIGMSARVDIEVEKKENVYGVPYSAVTKNGNNQDIVYVVESVNGVETPKETIVKTGMETDVSVEIKGDGIKDGVKIANDADTVSGKSSSLTPGGVESK